MTDPTTLPETQGPTTPNAAVHRGHLGGTAVREARGTGYLRKIAGHGGRTTKARHGSDFYARIGRKGNKAAYENWLAAKKVEATL